MRMLIGWLLIVLVGKSTMLNAAETVRYPDYPDVNKNFFLAALQLALDKSGHSYALAAVQPEMLQGRSITLAMGSKGSIDVQWSMTTREREMTLLPVRFPVDKGLLGWRLAIVRKDRVLQFSHVDSVQALRYFTAGLEHDWPDLDIMHSNGLPVMSVGGYEGLFSMLASNRFDYLPRGVSEAERELEAHQQLGLAIDPFIVIHYPTAEYFFVAPGKPHLAQHIRLGLERAHADGSFDRLFLSHFSSLLRRANLSKRRIIELNNPLVNARNLPTPDSSWWYYPSTFAPIMPVN